MDNFNGALVIGWDFSEGNKQDALVVMQGGRDDKMKAVNAFYNEDAHAVYDLLTGKRTLESFSKKDDHSKNISNEPDWFTGGGRDDILG